MHRLLSNPPRSNGIGSLSPTPKRITRSPHDELHLRSIRGFVEDRSGAVDLSDELIRTDSQAGPFFGKLRVWNIQKAHNAWARDVSI